MTALIIYTLFCWFVGQQASSVFFFSHQISIGYQQVSSIFLSHQISINHQPIGSNFFSQQISISHSQPDRMIWDDVKIPEMGRVYIYMGHPIYLRKQCGHS